MRRLPAVCTRRTIHILRSSPRLGLINVIRGYPTRITYWSSWALVISPQQIFIHTTSRYMCYSTKYVFYQVRLALISTVRWHVVRHIWCYSPSQEWHISDINLTLYYWLTFSDWFIDTFFWFYLTFTTHISVATSSDTFYRLQGPYVVLRNTIYFILFVFNPLNGSCF
jgi:hypothetical protein